MDHHGSTLFSPFDQLYPFGDFFCTNAAGLLSSPWPSAQGPPSYPVAAGSPENTLGQLELVGPVAEAITRLNLRTSKEQQPEAGCY